MIVLAMPVRVGLDAVGYGDRSRPRYMGISLFFEEPDLRRREARERLFR